MKVNLVLLFFVVWCSLITKSTQAGRFSSSLHFQRLFHATRQSIPVPEHQVKEKACCYPKQWQGLLYRYFFDYQLVANIYEDETNTRLAANATVNYSATESANVTQIILFDPATKSALFYMIDPSAKHCTKQNQSNITFEQIALPCMTENATFFGALPIGDGDDPSDSMGVKSWMQDAGGNFTYERVVSAKNCVPVFEIISGLSGKPSDLILSSYYFNIKTSIPDPSVFNPPSYCSKNVGAPGMQKRSIELFKSVWMWTKAV